MTELPRPINREQDFLAAIVSRLDQQNDLLTAIRDRLPNDPVGQPAAAGPGVEETQVELTEPASPRSGEGAALAEPAAPKKRVAAKKSPAKAATSRTGARGGTSQPRKGT